MQFKYLCATLIFLFSLLYPSFAQQQPIVLRHGGTVQSVAFSPVDNTLVASAGGHNTIKLWNLHQNTVKALTDHKAKVNLVAFSPNGKLLASGSEDRTIKIWDVSQWENIEIHEPVTVYMPYPIQTVAFHPYGQLLAASGRHVKLLDIVNQTESAPLRHNEWVWTLAFSPHGRYLATDDGIKTTVKIWDTQQKQITAILEGHTSDINCVKFSPDGRTFASSSWGREIKLWDVSNWERLRTFHTNGTAAIDFSPDRSILVSGGSEEVKLWSIDSGENIATLSGHRDWVRGVAFSPDSKTIASGGEGGMVHVQNVKRLLELKGQRNTVRLIYFLPRDRSPQPDIDTKLDKLIKDVQQVYMNQMDYYGFGRKTFQFETDATGKAVVHRMIGKFKDEYYHDKSNAVWDEIDERFDTSQNIYLAALDISTDLLDGFAAGFGGHNVSGGTALIPAAREYFGSDLGVAITAHELGHAFGLHHDYRNNLKPWIDLYTTDPMITSICAAGWLDAHSYFNTNKTYFNEPTTIEMLSPVGVSSSNPHLRFKIADLDSLHQAQLFSKVEYENTREFSILGCKPLDGTSSIVEFVTDQLTLTTKSVTLRVIDAYGNFTEKAFPIHTSTLLPVDVNVK